MGNGIDGRYAAYQINLLRARGDLSHAVEVCRQATRRYPADPFFFRILGDMQYELGLSIEALESYLEFARRIGEKTNLIAELFRFINKLRTNRASEIQDKLIYDRLTALIGDELLLVAAG